MAIIEKEVCDNCQDEDCADELFECSLCKSSNEVFCEECMEEHLRDGHKEELVDKCIGDSFDELAKTKK